MRERPIPPVEEVRPGIWSLPIAMPGPLVYVYAYALELRDGVLLVDASWDGDAALADLETGLGTLGARVEHVRGVLFTHAHRDHYGLAGRIRKRSGAWLGLHEAELPTLDHTRVDSAAALAEREAWLVDSGVADGELEAVLASMQRLFRNNAPTPVRPDRLLRGGPVDGVEPWRIEALETPGHSPGHLSYVAREAGVVFTGDHILSATSPIVSVFPGTTGNPLRDYLGSLERTIPLGDLLALPGHEGRVAVGPRARDLLAHHAERLADVWAAVDSGAATVRQIAERISWKRPWTTFDPLDLQMALGEVRAHLLVLEERGEVRPEHDGGLTRWTPVVER